MALFSHRKPQIPTPDEALAGRATPLARLGRALRERQPHRAALPRRPRARRLRHGLLLGRRAQVLAGPRRVRDGRRLSGRSHPEPQLRGGVQRPHRPHRGGARRLRPEAHEPTRRCCASSGRVTTRPRACVRATTWARSTARRSTCTRRSSAARAEASRELYQKRLREAGHGEITSEIREAPPFYYAEDYHQQYLAKNPRRLLRPRRHGRRLPGGCRLLGDGARSCSARQEDCMERVLRENAFAGETHVVTGAGQGIGRAIAATLALHGASVVMVDLDEGRLKEAAGGDRAGGRGGAGAGRGERGARGGRAARGGPRPRSERLHQRRRERRRHHERRAHPEEVVRRLPGGAGRAPPRHVPVHPRGGGPALARALQGQRQPAAPRRREPGDRQLLERLGAQRERGTGRLHGGQGRDRGAHEDGGARVRELPGAGERDRARAR